MGYMRTFGLDHEQARKIFAPTGSTKVADKKSDAVVLLYTTHTGKMGVQFYSGKRSKPDQCYSYLTATKRDEAISRFFQTCRDAQARKVKRREERRNEASTLEVGDILTYSYGYDETHTVASEIIEIKGCYATVRRISMASEDLGYDYRSRCMPQSGAFVGKPSRHLIQGDYLKIDGHHARKWNTKTVAGVKVGPSLIDGGSH